MMATTIQQFIPVVNNQDTKKRLQLGSDIISYLENPVNSVECDELGYFIDCIASWISNSNFKVAQNGLEIMISLADRLKENFKPYISTVFPSTVDRLGDSRDQVRDQAKALILKLMNPVSSPQYVFEKLAPAFNHKNWRVREEVMYCLQETLDRFGAQSLLLSKMMSSIVKLLGDPHSPVRDTAVNTLVHIYKHVGEKLRHDLTKRHNIPPAKLKQLNDKFDEVQIPGVASPTPSSEHGTPGEDDVDSRSQTASKSSVKRASSAPPARRTVFPNTKPPCSSALKRKHSMKSSSAKSSVSSSGSGAGGADEEMFIKAFEDVPRMQLYSTKELEQELNKVREILADPSNDWEKRNSAMKRLRSLLIAGAADYDEFYHHLRLLEPPFQMSVRDLRSQIVREACITIAYFSQQLGSKLDHFAEALLPYLINLIPNCAKIMSTAGIVAIHFIIQHTHVNRLIPVITSNLSSKSKDIRKACCEFLDQLLHTWPTHTLEKHVAILQEAIKKGISDADPEARAFSRKAFWGFADHFREQADSLLNSLDSSKQRMLQGELSMSNSSSSNSLTCNVKPLRPSTASHGGSVENLSRTDTKKSGIPVFKPDAASSIPIRMRSTSAIDLAAVRRAKARASFATAANLARGSGASLPRSSIRPSDTLYAVTSPERTMRTRVKGSSQSQPSSRPDSPSSRLNYATYTQLDGVTSGRTKHKSLIPTATGTSRDTSPSRAGYSGQERRSFGHRRSLTGAGEKYTPSVTSTVPVMAEKILQQSREAEAAMADALRTAVRRRYNAFDDQSDESETSSVCSDRSLGSFGRSIDDISEVIHNLNSIHWSDRKEGLLALQAFLRSSRFLTTAELKKVTDIFTKLFMDPHIKVFSLFLDTLNELILVHKMDLLGWLYILLARLFLKTGTDIRGSQQTKIFKTLELVRDSFPCEDQFNAVMHFLNDQTQTPNTKVKTALLHYLHSLICIMDPSEFTSSNNEMKVSIMKIISWTAGPKSSELRKHGEEVLVALFTLNAPEFSALLNQLPKPYQDSAFQLLNSQLRRHSTDISLSSGFQNQPCPVMSHLQTANSTLPRVRSHSGTPQNRSFEYDDTENLNPEDIYNSLKKTSAEIQKYNFDRLEQEFYGKEGQKNVSDSPTQDSCISPNIMQDGRLDTLEERLEYCSSTDSSPTKRSPMDYLPALDSETDGDRYDRENISDAVYEEDNEDDGQNCYSSIVSELNNHNTRNEQRKQALTRLIGLTRGGSTISEEHFRSILRVVIETVGDSESTVRALALRALCELIRKHAHNFHGYVELTVLKIVEAHRDMENFVWRVAETCSTVAASALPPEQCVRTLKPIILTGEPLDIQGAIKMLTKLIDQHPKNVIIQLLPEIMPTIIKAYDHKESLVRKAAVFCMVAIHGATGDAMKPYLSSLNSSKMKLLNLYIKRAQAQNSGGSTPGSPGNPPSSSSSH